MQSGMDMFSGILRKVMGRNKAIDDAIGDDEKAMLEGTLDELSKSLEGAIRLILKYFAAAFCSTRFGPRRARYVLKLHQRCQLELVLVQAKRSKLLFSIER